MGFPHKTELDTFGLDTLPDLSTVVLGALELFIMEPVSKREFPPMNHPLVVGSGNAAVTGKILFGESRAIFADESSYAHVINDPEIDGVVIVSASGGKHAVGIAQAARTAGKKAILLTNNPHPPARESLDDDAVFVFAKNREPYTYNTSTYLGMILAKSGEDPRDILSFIETEVAPRMPSNFHAYTAFYCIVPAQFTDLREMLRTKFDELFGSKVVGRSFTREQTKHAKTVVENDTELFISFGEENELFGASERRLFIPLPEHAGPAAMLAVGYYVIGRIQEQLPPYFRESIERYAREASQLFGQDISPIVE